MGVSCIEYLGEKVGVLTKYLQVIKSGMIT